MKPAYRYAAIAALGAGLFATTMIDIAEASRRVRTRNAIIGAVVAGGLIAGASGAYASPGYVVRRGPGCGEYRRRAIYAEDRGDYGRARYWWNRYEDCRAY